MADTTLRLKGSSGAVKSSVNKVIDLIIVFVCLIAIAICLLPLLNVLAISLSSQKAVTNNWVYFWPVELDFESYKSVFRDSAMKRSLLLTAVLTVVATCFSMLMTVLCAYPLAQNKFAGRTFFNTVIILTMYFNAGMIPDYINIKRLALLVVVVNNALSVGEADIRRCAAGHQNIQLRDFLAAGDADIAELDVEFVEHLLLDPVGPEVVCGVCAVFIGAVENLNGKLGPLVCGACHLGRSGGAGRRGRSRCG
ncbi:hypothetical protein FACS1894191_4810 [Clostridia bacterium]|nr:hypothetical protein FACS1894191_4810 [Clostridia bacterium]